MNQNYLRVLGKEVSRNNKLQKWELGLQDLDVANPNETLSPYHGYEINDPLAFPFEAMNAAFWEKPLVIHLNYHHDIELIDELLGELLFENLSMYDQVIYYDDTVFEYFMEKYPLVRLVSGKTIDFTKKDYLGFEKIFPQISGDYAKILDENIKPVFLKRYSAWLTSVVQLLPYNNLKLYSKNIQLGNLVDKQIIYSYDGNLDKDRNKLLFGLHVFEDEQQDINEVVQQLSQHNSFGIIGRCISYVGEEKCLLERFEDFIVGYGLTRESIYLFDANGNGIPEIAMLSFKFLSVDYE